MRGRRCCRGARLPGRIRCAVRLACRRLRCRRWRRIRLRRRLRIRLRWRWRRYRFRMVNQGRRRVRRRFGRRRILRGRRLCLAGTLNQQRGEGQACAKHHSAAPAHYMPISPHRRRTFVCNGTHSATPARRFCAETAAPFVYASVTLARKFTRPVQPRQSLRPRPARALRAGGQYLYLAAHSPC